MELALLVWSEKRTAVLLFVRNPKVHYTPKTGEKQVQIQPMVQAQGKDQAKTNPNSLAKRSFSWTNDPLIRHAWEPIRHQSMNHRGWGWEAQLSSSAATIPIFVPSWAAQLNSRGIQCHSTSSRQDSNLLISWTKGRIVQALFMTLPLRPSTRIPLPVSIITLRCPWIAKLIALIAASTSAIRAEPQTVGAAKPPQKVPLEFRITTPSPDLHVTQPSTIKVNLDNCRSRWEPTHLSFPSSLILQLLTQRVIMSIIKFTSCSHCCNNDTLRVKSNPLHKKSKSCFPYFP